jgi:hypothetical protein
MTSVLSAIRLSTELLAVDLGPLDRQRLEEA